MASKIISETVPEYPITGMVWVKPSSGISFMYIGGSWISIASGVEFSFHTPITIIMRGIDITKKTSGNFIKTDSVTSVIDTCSFNFDDDTQDYIPVEGEEVLIFHKTSESATPELIFGGRIQSASPRQKAAGIKKYSYTINCVDYSEDLNKRMAIESYENKTCKEIITNLVENYAIEFSVNNVQDGIMIDYISWNYRPLAYCLNELCEMTGGLFDWRVDANRDIHFTQRASTSAPRELNETTENGSDYRDLAISAMKNQLRNRVIVRGGYYLSNDFAQSMVADGEQKEFNLAHKPNAAASGGIEVYVDDGSGYVQKTVGIEFLNVTGFDFVVNYNDKVIKNLDLPTLNAGDKFKTVYKYEVPILVQCDDEVSQDLMKEREGGSGIYEHLIVDTTIATLDAARAKGEADLEQHSMPNYTGGFITNVMGWHSGQEFYINLPSRGITGNMLVKTAELHIDRTQAYFRIYFESLQTKTLTEFLVKLLDKSTEIIRRADEVLEEIATVSDTVVVTGSRDITEITPPYKWGAGTTGQEGTWGAAEWS